MAFASLENTYVAMLGYRSNATAATAMARRVLYISTFRDPWSGDHDFYPVLEEYDSLVKSWALSLAGDDPTVPPPVVFLDMASSLETVGNPRSFYSKDKIHFSPEPGGLRAAARVGHSGAFGHLGARLRCVDC